MNRREFLAASLAVAAVPLAGPICQEQQKGAKRPPREIVSATVQSVDGKVTAETTWSDGCVWPFNTAGCDFVEARKALESVFSELRLFTGYRSDIGWQNASVCYVHASNHPGHSWMTYDFGSGDA